MSKKEKSDSVVWSEKTGYNSSLLEYGSNISAPSIKLENVNGWKQGAVVKVNHQFQTRYDELIEEAKKLVDEYNWNELVYNSEYSFIPVIGKTYHLYIKDNDKVFLSLIEPHEWKQKYVASFKLDSTEKWIKI